MTFLLSWTLSGKTESKEFPDERLQEMLDRAWRKFGNPAMELGSPTNEISRLGPGLTLPPPRTITKKRAGK